MYFFKYFMESVKIMKKITAIVLLLVMLLGVFLASCTPDEVQDVINNNTGKELAVPTNLYVRDTVLYWNIVEYASFYTVLINGTTYTSTTNSYSLQGLPSGEYTLSVMANGDGVMYKSSAYSDTITYTRDTDTGEEYKDQISGAFGSFDEINTRESYLGYGIDIINATGVTSKNIKTTYPIFSKNALIAETLLKSNEHYSNLETIEASTIEEFKSKVSSSTSISAGASASASGNIYGVQVSGGVSFSAGYKTSFEQTSTETHSQYFLEIIAENQNYWLMLQTTEARYKELLSEEFKRDLYDTTVTPAALFDKYGTHLLTSVAMGGNISMFYTLYSTHEGVTTDQYYEVSTSLKTNADVAYGGYSAGTSTENSTHDSLAFQEIANKYGIRVEKKIVVSGGSGDFGIINESSLLNNYADWQKSLDAYPVVVGIKDTNSLYPIWNLIDTSVEGGAERYQELYNYFAQYGQEQYNSLCETYGITAPVAPTGIDNISIKTYTDYEEGEIVQIKAGETFQITFDVLPETANKYSKTFRSDSEYVTVDERGNVIVSTDIPNHLPVTITITAGSIEKNISLVTVATCNVVFNTVVDGLTVPSIIGINSATTISEPAVYREGYTLEGWYRDAAYTSKFIFDSDLVVTNLVLYARWLPIKPVITFESNLGTAVDSQTIAYKGKVQKPENPTRDGYTFDGWYVDKELTVEFDFELAVLQNTTLYAKWKIINYTVKFETNGGTPIANKFTNVDRDYKITEVTTERTNFVFKGWFTDEDFFTEFTFNDKITSDTTLYAKWEAVKPIITFVSNGGSDVEGQIIASNSVIKEPSAPVKDGYKFIGWYADKELTEKFNFSNPVIVHTTLYAKWEKLVFTVTFETNGGTPVSNKTTSIDKDYKITEPTTIKNHYVLDGWYLDDKFEVRFYFTEEVTSNITLYAKWSVYNVVVSFLDDDGSASLVAADGEKIVTKETNYLKEYAIDSVPTPYKKGYVFLGWTMGGQSIDVTRYSFDNENAVYKIYANWIDERYASPIKITVNYVFENGTEAAESFVDSTNYYYEQEYSIKSPIVAGYAPSQLVVSGTVPDKALTIQVVYKLAPQNVNITYVMADGSTAPNKESVPVIYGEAYMIAVPKINGYTADKTTIAGTMGTTDVNVTVTYTPNKYKLTILYVMANGAEAPQSYVAYIDYNQTFSITVEDLAGYTADATVVKGKMSDGDQKFVVTYVPNEYTLTINHTFIDGKASLSNIVKTYKHGESYAIPVTAVKGYVPNVAEVNGTINAQNAIITVTYTPSVYYVEYVANGANGKTEATTHMYNVENYLAASTFEKAGYVFLGWDTEQNGTGTRYANGQLVKNLTSTNGDRITLYAQWISLSFNTNPDLNGDGKQDVKTTISWSGMTNTATYGTKFTIPAPSASYYKFVGWCTEDGILITDAYGNSINVCSFKKETVIIAKWEQEYKDYTYIQTKSEFMAIKNKPSKKYLLLNDIDLQGAAWEPISVFSGDLKGEGNSVYNFTINMSGTGSATIAFIIQNTGNIEGLVIGKSGEKLYDGLYSVKYTISYNESKSASTLIVGGIVAENSGTIKECSLENVYMNASMADKDNDEHAYLVVGGIAANNMANSKIISCNVNGSKIIATMPVSSNSGDNNYGWLGGISGKNYGTVNTCVVKDTSFEMSVYGDGCLKYFGYDPVNDAYPTAVFGEIIGEQMDSGILENSVALNNAAKVHLSKGNYTHPTYYAGTIVGLLGKGGTVNQCYAHSSLSITIELASKSSTIKEMIGSGTSSGCKNYTNTSELPKDIQKIV